MNLYPHKFRYLPALAAFLCCCGCVTVPAGFGPAAAQRVALDAPVEGLDPGYKTEETAHFKVNAYSSAAAARYAALCEENYTRIMQDLGIYSFVPATPYNVSVYRDAAEYHLKTGQPDWSGGAAYGNALLLYEGDGLTASLGHEMTHLIFNEFMGLSQTAQLRWLNEGVAVYEESRSSPESSAFYAQKVREAVVPNPIPFSQMVNLAPQGESLRTVDRWYAQAGSVTGFMLRAAGAFNFSLFLSKLRDANSVDQALKAAYPGTWGSLADVERTWLAEMKR